MSSSEDLDLHFHALAKEAGKDGLGAIHAKMIARSVAAGEKVIEAGQPADSVYFLVSGRLVVSLPFANGTVEVGSFGPGAILGEVAVLDPAPASATVAASEASVVLALTRSALAALEAEEPRAASAVLHTLTHTLVERTRLATERLEELRGESGAPPPRHGLLDAVRHLFGFKA